MFKIRVLNKVFDSKTDKETESFMICTDVRILFGWSNQERWDVLSVWHVWGRGGVHTGFWWGNLKEKATRRN